MPRLALVSRRVEGLSGAVRLILAEAQAARAKGYAVDIFAQKIDVSAVKEVGATAHRLLSWPWGSWTKRRHFAAVAQRAVSTGFDIVHGHGDLLGQDILSLHNCVHQAHFVQTGKELSAHDAIGRMHDLQLKNRSFRCLIANSKLMKADIVSRYQIPDEFIEVVYPGYDDRRFHTRNREQFRSLTRQELRITNENILFGFITSGDFEKRGLSKFLKAFAITERLHPEARALVVGKENNLEPYLNLTLQLGISQKVIFRNPIADVDRFYHALDVYVHAAAWDEFAMTVIEAMACGVCAISGQQIGATELFNGELKQLIVRNSDPEVLAQSMVKIASDPPLRAHLCQLAAQVVRPYDLSAHGRHVATIYERFLKK